MQDINLTALIDIVFHLMVFVMLTTSFVVSESMELSLPSGKAGAASGAGHIIRIQITPDGALLADQKPVNSDGLTAVLASRLGEDPNTKIAIFTMAGVNVQQLITVMDTVYLTGGRDVQVDKVQ